MKILNRNQSVIGAGGVSFPTGVIVDLANYPVLTQLQLYQITLLLKAGTLDAMDNEAVLLAGLSSGQDYPGVTGGTANYFVDNETPSGTQDSSNQTFYLAKTPSPAESLEWMYNGQILTAGIDYTLTVNAVVYTTIRPTNTDIQRASYRYNGAGSVGGGGSSSVGTVVLTIDNETPTGAYNGSNQAYTLSRAPNPTTSLKLSYNGQALSQGDDYTLSGTSITLLFLAPTALDNLRAAYIYGTSSGAPASVGSIISESLGGTKNGVNTGFTVSYVPTSTFFALYLNGQRLKSGVGYTRSGLNITALPGYIPSGSDTYEADYI